MIESKPVKYLGLALPEITTNPNATIIMTENCAVVIKDCLLGSPMDRIALTELEGILSNMFGCKVEINCLKTRLDALLVGRNPHGETPVW